MRKASCINSILNVCLVPAGGGGVNSSCFLLFAGILLVLLIACSNPSSPSSSTSNDSSNTELPGSSGSSGSSGSPGSSGSSSSSSKDKGVAPQITSQPRNAVYNQSSTATALMVRALSMDGGLLSYQWYSNTKNSNTGGTAITGARKSNYIPSTNTVGIMYYYAVVTNTSFGKTAEAASNTAQVTINSYINAETPVITGHPQGATYHFSQTATPLTVTVQDDPPVDGGTLSYQWFSNNTNSNTGGTEIPGEITDSYTPPTDTAGTVYYYVEVSNTISDNGDGGEKTATVASDAATITVNTQVNAGQPVIGTQPLGTAYIYGDTVLALTVTAVPPSAGGTLSYQWYSNTINSNSGGTAVSGVLTSANYTPVVSNVGAYYYYVVITNTISDNGDGGDKDATITSAVAAITVNPKPVTITGVSAEDKTYDGNTTATATGTPVVDGRVGLDNVTVNTGSASFADKNVGTGKTVTFSGWTLGGAAAGNYTLSAQPANATANITAKPVSLTANNKTYDGTTAATVDTSVINGKVDGDDLTVSGSGTAVFADANAGTGKTVTCTGNWELGGTAAGNYTLSATTTADITPAPATITGIGTPNRTLIPFDSADTQYGKTATFNVTVSGLIGSDTVTVDISGYGLSLSSNTGINNGSRTVTLTYDGTTAVTQTTAFNVALTISGNYYGSANVSVIIIDGQAVDRAIPITQSNITAFNTYANEPGGLAKHYKLTGNITLTIPATGESNWTAIANNTNRFTGSFDGDNKTISNLTINATTNYQGMFGYIGTGGVVQKLGLIDCSVNSSNESTSFNIGGLVGHNEGTVQNCYTTGSVTSSGIAAHSVGGLVGRNNGTVQNCYATCNVNGAQPVGGVAGINYGTVQNCYATGEINSNGNVNHFLGGVVGINVGTIQNCYVTGIVRNTNTYYNVVGGVAASNSASIRNCIALNPSVMGGERGRVVSSNNNVNSTLANNYARSDLSYSGVISDRDGKDGADISAGQYNSSGWWSNSTNWKTDEGASAWNFTTVWEWNSTTNLPTLRNMPSGAQNHTVP